MKNGFENLKNKIIKTTGPKDFVVNVKKLQKCKYYRSLLCR